jgi:hypothetical protein
MDASRTRMPGWGWALIAIASVLIVTMTVTSTVLAGSVLVRLASGGLGGSGNPTVPSAGELAIPRGDLPLTDSPYYGAGPYWTLPDLDTWEIQASGDSDTKQYMSTTHPCWFATYRYEGDGAQADQGDRIPSRSAAYLLAGSLTNYAAADSVRHTSLEPREIDSDGGAASVEFLAEQLDYTDPDTDTAWTEIYLVRDFTASNIILVSAVECAAGVLESDPSILASSLDLLEVASR